MHGDVMSNEENYCFDVAGYLHVPGALNAQQIARLNGAIDGVGELAGMLAWPGDHKEPEDEPEDDGWLDAWKKAVYSPWPSKRKNLGRVEQM